MATDMIHHKKMVETIADTMATSPPGLSGAALLEALSPEHRKEMIAMIVHAADVSNTCRPAGPAGEWAKRVTEGAQTTLPFCSECVAEPMC